MIYLQFILLSIDDHGGDLLIHEDENRGQEGRNDRSEPERDRVLLEWIDKPPASLLGRGEVLWDNQFRRVQTDQIVNGDIDEDGENHAEVAHFRTDLQFSVRRRSSPFFVVTHRHREESTEFEVLQHVGENEGGEEEKNREEEHIGNVRLVVNTGTLDTVEEEGLLPITILERVG